MSRNPAVPMSIDAMLDMEREEVLALLESKNSGSAGGPMRSSSPYTTAPRSPVRSMLDVGDDDAGSAHGRTSPVPQPPVRSMLDIDGPPPAAQPVRSMLDVGGPAALRPSSQTRAPYNRSVPSSPTMATSSLYKGSSQPPISRLHPRSSSDAAFKPAEFGARKPLGSNDRTSEYQFSGILPSSASGNLPGKRASQSKRTSGGSSLVEALRGYDFSGLQLPSRARNSSANRPGYHQSKSPHNRWNDRSKSPAVPRDPNQVMLSDGRIVDMNNAYRRLSDANLAFSSGSLSQLPMRKRSDDAGTGRLIKDYLGPDGEHLESSDDDEAYSSDDEDRGRTKAPRSLNPDAKGESDDDNSRSRSGGIKRAPLSLLAAADEDRSNIASQQSYQYRSLLEPEIKVTNTSGETVKPSKAGVHPHTSYDHNPNSATQSVVDSDEEADVDDIKRAQNLSFTMTNVLHNPEAHRSIRIIYRGEYHKITQSAEEEHRRLRKYLVATDLSDESTHALEWAIGTVIRDGDTLIAIYCVDEETGVVTGEGSQVPDDPAAMKEQAAAINTVTNTKVTPAPLSPVTEFKRLHRRDDSSGTTGSSPAPTAVRGERTKAEEERERAIQGMTEKILRLLRKTKLQVRVIVEVLHCKNPRHLITEVIDLVNPTLVVIGSRGRSALKGVILGSFSNYLVTKSSVPVMVARKRLRKQSKYKQKAIRQVNNLSNPTARSLASAKID
ncbi:universal stress protein [Cordyceps fumosorosea ARSEF 2679]|uniref:Universal stress protein n=1 Tax=Cordyceps fumosorosea (strain ARSEF 2679) TaxID=1081104 RepID=A0A167SCB4_CORFA|nr:universal stress protein [Cordyceps fumosorosea ARSEF 2679]OAA59483.1 universal stress protein [Cordyceps fumosorosea ARSEF 2679]